jgi:hypothetical protein
MKPHFRQKPSGPSGLRREGDAEGVVTASTRLLGYGLHGPAAISLALVLGGVSVRNAGPGPARAQGASAQSAMTIGGVKERVLDL